MSARQIPPGPPKPGEKVCARCNGSGVIVLNNPPRTVTCPACKGSGKP